MRLNRYLQKAGVASRRKADALIFSGKVRVNGRVVQEPWYEVRDTDVVEVHNRPVRIRKYHRYFKYYKPRGVTTTLRDRHASLTLRDVLPDHLRGIFPVGRLDRDSEGLLLLTDDGDLAYILTHPRFEVLKVYRVWFTGSLHARDVARRLQQGLTLEDGPFHPLFARPIEHRAVELGLTEGRKREIRRAMAALGLEVERLLRTQFGPITLGGLREGGLSTLTPREMQEIRRLKARMLPRLRGETPSPARKPRVKRRHTP